ncbi:Signal transduction histidine kinase CheA [Methanosarcina sp. MTP4]|uniref:chemotaxis protein CheA n=1 Tax=Methanosarcina sp. MTP4 TaxID=1434100 RepID=UPI0006158185|nr:chemotaxis protein CheA [Methanosarcina sp. MTP4]AKB26709.1 Signal transduction histidine kinase CheA [Methanosarcina sp. MTP4]
MDLSKYMGIFREESERNLKQLNDSLLALEQNPENTEHVNIVFRLAHTFKGMAATMGFKQIVELTHEMENLIERIRTQQLKLDASLIDLLFECLDSLEGLVENACKNAGIKPSRGKTGEEEKSKTYPDPGEVLKALRAINTPITANTKEKTIGKKVFSREEEAEKERETKEEKNSEEVPLYPDEETSQYPARKDSLYLGARKEVPETGEDSSITESSSTTFSITEEGIPTTEIEFSEKERALMEEAEMDGAKVMLAHIALQDTCLLKSARSALVIRKISENGKIIRTFPSINELEKENFGLDFEVVFSTKKDGYTIKTEISNISEIEDVSIRSLSSEEGYGEAYREPVPVHEKTTGKLSETLSETSSETSSENLSEISSENLSEGPSLEKTRFEPEKMEGEAVTGGKMPFFSKPNPKIKNIQSVRVSTEQLDKLMNLAGELVITRSRINQLTLDFKSKELEETLSELRKLTGEMQEEVIEARMVPLDHILNIFPRMVRDLAKSENKKLDFIIRGKEIKLDRTVLDEIGNPLVHLLRNAVDHGIESPEKRLELGKKETGTIMLKASRQENYVIIKIEDDGQGIDPTELRKAAEEQGIISREEAEQLPDREAMQLIFNHGFSTASRVTDVSGRGVGMDVVKNRIENLGGSIKIESKPGKGTRFELKLPLTIALYQAMLVEVGNERYAIPFTNIIKNIEIQKEAVRHINGEEVTMESGKVLPLLRLHSLFGLPVEEREKLVVVVAEKAGQVIGIVVDRLLGKQEVIIKTFKSKLLEETKGFAGATIMGDGNVVLILDINTLV